VSDEVGTVVDRIADTIRTRDMAGSDTPVLLMVSGGSDSTALAYIAVDLHGRGVVGPLAMLHVNHGLRGAASDADAEFTRTLAEALSIPFFLCEVDIPGMVARTGENMEAIARRERYLAAHDALESLCRHAGAPLSDGCVFTAHTQDDRVESFFMRSIVGTGPGGLRAMRYGNGPVRRPCLDVGRDDLRDYLNRRALDADAGEDIPLVRDGEGSLWREDATNAHTDRFRAYVRHEIVPKAKARNPRLLDVLCRTMNLIADEDDMLEARVADIVADEVAWLVEEGGEPDCAAGCVLLPRFARHAAPIRRRAAANVLHAVLGADVRIEASSVEAMVNAFENGLPISGYTNNIQGDLALSANKRGLRIEPMAAYRARRKR
jgi:tRNA(Ile)-lysidine synthase